MNDMQMNTGYIVDVANLPKLFPTHRQKATFWEHLGRTVATFGLLEDCLARAIFALTATRRYPESEIAEVFEAWIPKLERALSDTLGSLIDQYGSAVRNHADSKLANPDDLISNLKAASKLRNAICHGAWGAPNPDGFCELRYFTKSGEAFDTLVDDAFLTQLQRHAAELIAAVVSSITIMGWQFPGSSGPGDPIVK
ncbi:hypothetical protein AB4Z52_07030 [Rhizobium sp. 2YAF20]|uniref:hypothetical protein n=1 Tax=Rhizobium sp. 2YAF20 TaxID=3233027 RepID=UPI003F96090C